MKKKIGIFVALGILLVVAGLLYFSMQKHQEKKEQTERIKKFPTFEFYDRDSMRLDFSALPPKPTVLIYFHSGCDYCQAEAKQLQEAGETLSKANIIMVSTENLQKIQVFGKKYGLDTFSHFYLVKTSEDSFRQIVGSVSVPSLWIYDREGNLVKQYKGETKIEAILKHL